MDQKCVLALMFANASQIAKVKLPIKSVIVTECENRSYLILSYLSLFLYELYNICKFC